MQAPLSHLLFSRVSPLRPTVRQRSEPQRYRSSHRFATRFPHRLSCLFSLSVSVLVPAFVSTPCSRPHNIGPRQTAIVIVSSAQPFSLRPWSEFPSLISFDRERALRSVGPFSPLLRPRVPFRDRDPPWTYQPELALQAVPQIFPFLAAWVHHRQDSLSSRVLLSTQTWIPPFL